MELGVDISALNVVHLRNVPPTPANYAQRSGRAGRSGMAALVITYCASQSPHDQYFFREPRNMVHGQVRAPLLDLANRDLVESPSAESTVLKREGQLCSLAMQDAGDAPGDRPVVGDAHDQPALAGDSISDFTPTAGAVSAPRPTAASRGTRTSSRPSLSATASKVVTLKSFSPLSSSRSVRRVIPAEPLSASRVTPSETVDCRKEAAMSRRLFMDNKVSKFTIKILCYPKSVNS